MRLRIFLLWCFLLPCLPALAQTNKKADHCYNDAIRYRSKKQMEKAYKKMEQAIACDPAYAEAYAQLGEWYFAAHKFPEAVQVFQKGTANCRNGALRFAKPLARCYIYAGLADNAIALITNYATIKDSAEWNKMKVQAYFVRDAMAHQSVADWPVNLGLRVNSGFPELFPSMAVDSQHLYFTRRAHLDEDFYEANNDSCGGWLYAYNMGTPPNTPNQESSQFISADGHYLFFTRCDNRSPDGWAEGGCDLFMAYRIANDSPWTVAQPFGATINTPYYEGMPTLSPDNRELYFVSDRPGGYGGLDIWVSRFEDGLWQLPVNAGPNINTPGNDMAPYMNVDNQTFYFTSDGRTGLGGTDIFVSRKINDTTYTKAQNLGFPINTAYDEMSECVTLDGSKLYFASDRQGPAGNFDLYESKLQSFQKPVPVSYIEGIVYDSISKLRLNYAAIYICNAANGDTIYHFQSNRGDASFLITLHLGNTYAIHTQRMGYTDIHDTIVFDKQYLEQPLQHNIAMLPTDYVAPVNDSLLTTIHFDAYRIELEDSDKNNIRNAIQPWMNGKPFTLFVNAYTDNTGTPMVNEQLSFQRANQIAAFINTLGVDESMMQAKGWGESKMITTNETPEGRRMNRRVEIILRR